MTATDATPNFNLYVIKEFLEARACNKIINELSGVSHSPATVYGNDHAGSVDDRVRKTIRLIPESETLELVNMRLSELRSEVGNHFGIRLDRFEDPQFLRYCVGDFFVAHQDGNTGLLLSEREQFRKISVVVFLNQEAEAPESGLFCGGSLVFTEWRAGRTMGQYRLIPEQGMLVAFPSELTHEVMPVTCGERYSIVSWYG